MEEALGGGRVEEEEKEVSDGGRGGCGGRERRGDGVTVLPQWYFQYAFIIRHSSANPISDRVGSN
jgi:hypothetical protein